jgi:hypothetical protein
MKKWIIREGGFAIIKVLARTFTFLNRKRLNSLVAFLVRILTIR